MSDEARKTEMKPYEIADYYAIAVPANSPQMLFYINEILAELMEAKEEAGSKLREIITQESKKGSATTSPTRPQESPNRR